MKEGEIKDFPFKDGTDKEAFVHVQKYSGDNYSGYLSKEGKILARFKNRSLPGVGIILLSTFELYDFDDNKIVPKVEAKVEVKPESTSLSSEINKLIEDRLNLHSIIKQVVDQRITEREALDKAINEKIFSMLKLGLKGEDKKEEAKEEIKEEKAEKIEKNDKEKIGLKLKAFLEKKKSPVAHGISIIMAKSEGPISCPDCGQTVFSNNQANGCLCCGENREAKIFIKKSDDGIKVRFSKDWTQENISLLLETLRNRKSYE